MCVWVYIPDQQVCFLRSSLCKLKPVKSASINGRVDETHNAFPSWLHKMPFRLAAEVKRCCTICQVLHHGRVNTSLLAHVTGWVQQRHQHVSEFMFWFTARSSSLVRQSLPIPECSWRITSSPPRLRLIPRTSQQSKLRSWRIFQEPWRARDDGALVGECVRNKTLGIVPSGGNR